MLLSNFKISFQSHGSSVCIIKPEDEQIHFTHPAKVALIASTSDNLCAQASQLMQQFATEQGIEKYLLLNEGYVAAIGVQAVKKAIRPYLVLHFSPEWVEICLVEPQSCTLAGHGLQATAPLRLICHKSMPYNGLRQFIRGRYAILISQHEEQRILELAANDNFCSHVEINGINPHIGVGSSMIFDFNQWVEYRSLRQRIIVNSVDELLEEWSGPKPTSIYITGDYKSYGSITDNLRQKLGRTVDIHIADNAESAVEEGFAYITSSF